MEMDVNDTFDKCVRAFWTILQKYRRLHGGDAQTEKLLNSMEEDFWIAQLSIMVKIDPKRAREMAKRLNMDTEKHDKRLDEFL